MFIETENLIAFTNLLSIITVVYFFGHSIVNFLRKNDIDYLIEFDILSKNKSIQREQLEEIQNSYLKFKEEFEESLKINLTKLDNINIKNLEIMKINYEKQKAGALENIKNKYKKIFSSEIKNTIYEILIKNPPITIAIIKP
jgi:hypothetical protein